MDLLFYIKNVILQVLQNKSRLNDFNLNKEQVYAFTNENIAGYVGDLEISSEMKTLIVCSGGDHLLNLGVKSILDVDLIDVNPMTEYFSLGIKIPLVLAYTFEEFFRVIDFLFKSRNYDLSLEKNILYRLLYFMNLKYKLFFKEVFDYYFMLQEKYRVPVKLMQILTTDYYFNKDEIVFYNLYLQQKENYNRLRTNINKMRLSFQKGSVFDFNNDDYYDLVLCSNALEHTYIPSCNMAKLKLFLSSLMNSLTSNGIIMASYMYGFYDPMSDSYLNYPIKGTDITIREVLRENYILVDNCRNSKDAVLVLRK